MFETNDYAIATSASGPCRVDLEQSLQHQRRIVESIQSDIDHFEMLNLRHADIPQEARTGLVTVYGALYVALRNHQKQIADLLKRIDEEENK